MSSHSPPVDQAVRERALDPRRSFIVQAPAGSGKTGLLTQRYLQLLSCVQRPESIIAITFTRKAAGEMQERILCALQQARDLPEPEADYEKVTWRLARKALQQDQEQGWSLLDNPGCLRIQTFDSFCSKLAAQMPLLSSFGAVPSVVEDSRRLYLQAAESTLAQLENNVESARHIAILLGHLDNRLDNLRELLADMLARRDQWLRHVADPADPRLERENIEQALQNIVVEALLHLVQSLPPEHSDELLNLLRFAAAYCADETRIASCRDIEVLPQASLEGLGQWQAIAELLLTKDGGWRKRITVAQGFPAPSSSRNKEEKARLAEMKERMQTLLQALSENENFRERLAGLENLPATHYCDHEWQILNALFALLPYSVAHLRLVFQERGEVDFAEISLRAIQALGDDDAPSDLALKLDYQIQHLLVDEFQDTSINQYALIKNLIAGWEENDGRSLFLVGDPMQSIYRFREAEVGLFLETCESGLAQKKLDFLQLQVNFRSCENIIDWSNKNFLKIFPPENDPLSGAVSYAASVAAKAATSEQAIKLHTFIARDDQAEAEAIVNIIRRAPAEQSIAVLVRNRSHLLQLSKQLREQGIRFQAVDIDALLNRPVVQDLLALTRALLHPADRIAWLSILRAPFCGLSLSDLHRLCVNEQARTLLDLLHDDSRRAALSADGEQRIRRVLPVLQDAMQNRARQNLRLWVEHAWLALGGPACLLHDAELVDAEEFFFLLEELDSSSEAEAISELQDRVEKLYAKPDTGADGRLQLMTIHKAKGLEFDTVIVPGLGKTPKADSSHLLYWLEQPGMHGDTDLLFGPIKSARGEQNKTAEYIQALETEKKYLENARLLYVAVTRAKKQLHLFAHAEPDSRNGLRQPGKNTLLACLWPAVVSQFQEQLEKQSTERAADSDIATEMSTEPEQHTFEYRPRSRLVPDWQCPPPPPGIQPIGTAAEITDSDQDIKVELEFDWAGDSARQVGIVAHRLLEQIARRGVEHYRLPSVNELQVRAESMLIQTGIAHDSLAAALRQVVSAIENILNDERGRWILSGTHQQAACELALSIRIADEVRRLVIDRTFVDKDGTRWIIDYKTGSHAGAGLEAFLDSEQERYRHQLQRYAAALQKMESRKIRMALYFPLLKAWREWG